MTDDRDQEKQMTDDRVVFTGGDILPHVLVDDVWCPVGNLEAVNWTVESDKGVRQTRRYPINGTARFATYDIDGNIEGRLELDKPPVHLILQGVTKRGDMSSLAILGIEATKYIDGRATNNLCCTIGVEFKASEVVGWAPRTLEETKALVESKIG